MTRGSTRRLSVASPQGRRGAGLGNEVFALAKAHIGAVTLGATLVEQPWWLNPRRYGHVLGYNIVPPLVSATAGMWVPKIQLTRQRVSNPWDYTRSMETLSPALPRSCVVVHASGMAGGYLGIRDARLFLRQRLGVVPRQRKPADPLRVGLHIRAGDFSFEPVRPGVFNARLSVDWVLHAVRCVLRCWPADVQLAVYTDARSDDPSLTGLLGGLPVSAKLASNVSSGGVLDDLRGLASSDVIIPSVSSFSMLALFLSDAAYLWPEHHLDHSAGWLSIWGNEPDSRSGPISRNIRRVTEMAQSPTPRGIPLRIDQQPDLRQWLVQATEDSMWCKEADLLLHGVVQEDRLAGH